MFERYSLARDRQSWLAVGVVLFLVVLSLAFDGFWDFERKVIAAFEYVFGRG